MTTSQSTKDKSRLFRKSRPLIRKFEENDRSILWAAYKAGSFDIPEGLVDTEFLIALAQRFGNNDLLWVVEDDHKGFKSGRGPVSLVGIKTDGWTYRPSAVFFKWASKRNILRCWVAFFQFIRSRKDVGVCVVEVREKEKEMPFRMRDYGLLFPRGRIPNGSPDGDVFVFSITGKK